MHTLTKYALFDNSLQMTKRAYSILLVVMTHKNLDNMYCPSSIQAVAETWLNLSDQVFRDFFDTLLAQTFNQDPFHKF